MDFPILKASTPHTHTHNEYIYYEEKTTTRKYERFKVKGLKSNPTILLLLLLLLLYPWY